MGEPTMQWTDMGESKVLRAGTSKKVAHNLPNFGTPSSWSTGKNRCRMSEGRGQEQEDQMLRGWEVEKTAG